MSRFLISAVAVAVAGAIATAHRLPARNPQTTVYERVILGGRVMDPESRLDAVRNVGIRDGKVAVITAAQIVGRDTIDARSLVVAPGFIDLHQHAQDSASYALEVRDGTTTALELEDGTADVSAWYAARAGRSLINHGVAIGHLEVRARVLGDTSATTPPTGAGASRGASDGEQLAIVRGIADGLRDGAVAVGMGLGYTPGARPWEVFQVFRAAAAANASVHVHLRELDEALYFLETEEVIAASVASGAPVHIVHIQSSGGDDTPRMLEMLRGARARGVDVTTELYPYTAAMMEIESVAFSDWRDRDSAYFRRLEWPATGERLTRESFGRYRAQRGFVVIHPRDEVAAERALRVTMRDSLPMIASDGILSGGVGHPRAAGTHARVLGRHVRELGDLTLMEALRRMSLAPAQRLERRVPAMRNKGRLRRGADADIVVFDATRVLDRATYREPTMPSAGIVHVLVNGTPVVRGERLVGTAVPGRPVRASNVRSVRQRN